MTPERANILLTGQDTARYQGELTQAKAMGAEAIRRCMVAKKPKKGWMFYICPSCDQSIEKRDHTHGLIIIS